MHHFDYRDGVLHAEAVSLDALAAAVGTPFYCYSTATLTRHYEVFADAFADVDALVCYAMKANSNQAVLRTLAKLGAGADVVSGGELKRARAAGIDGIVCSAAETEIVREVIGPDMVIVTPGIRPSGSAAGDQKRTLTPAEAIRVGADHLVVGRPIIRAADPRAAAGAVMDEIVAAS